MASAGRHTMNRQDIPIIISIVVLMILIRIPTVDYPLAGDSSAYAATTLSLATQGTYSIDGQPHNKYPPVYSIASLPIYYLTHNPATAIRYTNTLFGILTVVLIYAWSRHLSFTKTQSATLCLLIALNPFYTYFTGIFAYSEGAAIFLFTTGLYFYMHKTNNKNIYLSGILMGLSCLTRTVFIAFIAPFLVYAAYTSLKESVTYRRKGLTVVLKTFLLNRHLHFAFLTILPLIIWSFRNMLVLSQISGQGYSNDLTFYRSFPYFFVLYLAVIIPLTFLTITPFAYRKYYRTLKSGLTGKLLFFSSASYIIAISLFSWDVWHFNIIKDGQLMVGTLIVVIVAATRYALPLVPIWTLLAFKEWNNFTKSFRWPILAIMLALTILFNFGSVQNALSETLPLPETYVQRSEYRADAIDWINHNAPQGSTIAYSVKEPGQSSNSMGGLSQLLKYMFRDDLIPIALEESEAVPPANYYMYDICIEKSNPLYQSGPVCVIGNS